MKVQLLSHAEVYKASFELSRQITSSGYDPEWVIAIARGGFPVARYVCDFLDIKNLASLQLSHYASAAEKKKDVEVRNNFTAEVSGKRLLLVDDVNDSGKTLQAATELLRRQNPAELRSAVLHHKESSRFQVDYCTERISEWRWITYPWAAMEDLEKFVGDLQLQLAQNSHIRSRLREEYDMNVPEELVEKWKCQRGESS